MSIRKFVLFVTVSFPLRAGEGETDDQESDKDKGNSNSDQESDKEKGGKEQDSYTAAQVKEIRDEAAKYRTSLRTNEKAVKDLQAKLKTFEDKDKSELQKAQDEITRLAELNKSLSSKTVYSDGVAAAVRYNAVDPEVVARCVDSDSEKTVDEQVKDLVKTRPFLFKSAGSGDGGKGGERGREQDGKTSMNDLIRGKR